MKCTWYKTVSNFVHVIAASFGAAALMGAAEITAKDKK